MSNEPQEGENPQKQAINKEVSMQCPSCGRRGVTWIERILLDGDLDLYYLVHTEVEDVYECPACHNTWRHFGFL
jgi:DNA-directed RNA polymerase subunit M/transcription elongation factor TFIIS